MSHPTRNDRPGSPRCVPADLRQRRAWCSLGLLVWMATVPALTVKVEMPS